MLFQKKNRIVHKIIKMYHCLYCRITLRKESEKIYEEHEFGFRHKTNKILFFKKNYNLWVKKKQKKSKIKI